MITKSKDYEFPIVTNVADFGILIGSNVRSPFLYTVPRPSDSIVMGAHRSLLSSYPRFPLGRGTKGFIDLISSGLFLNVKMILSM